MLLQPPRLSLLVGRDWQPMFASLQGRFTASHPPGLVTEEARHRDGGARGVETCADDPLASQQPCLGLLGPEALPLVGKAPGCDLSDPSHVMEPRGTTSHMAMAMDPVPWSSVWFRPDWGQSDYPARKSRSHEWLWV